MRMNWSPSLMLVDILDLRKQIELLTDAGSTSFHIDIMDGNYVPNITLGTMDLIALNRISTIPLEVHLMVNEPSNVLGLFNYGAISTIFIHPETCTHLHRTISEIKRMGKRAGIVINPSTSLNYVEEMIEDLDVVMVMAVNPGYAGQKFIASTFRKIERTKSLIRSYGKEIEILVDGSISTENIGQLVECGANGFVLGSAGLFRDDFDYKRNIEALKNATLAKGVCE